MNGGRSRDSEKWSFAAQFVPSTVFCVGCQSGKEDIKSHSDLSYSFSESSSSESMSRDPQENEEWDRGDDFAQLSSLLEGESTPAPEENSGGRLTIKGMILHFLI